MVRHVLPLVDGGIAVGYAPISEDRDTQADNSAKLSFQRSEGKILYAPFEFDQTLAIGLHPFPRMEEYLDDAEIARLIAVEKALPGNWEARLRTRLRAELSHKRSSLEIATPAGTFTIIIRESMINARDFSVILAFTRGNGALFRLRRYNGLHGGHTNHIERQQFRGCHIHMATIRYQIAGYREDAFAVPSDSFTDVASAIRLMMTECGFKMPDPETVDQGGQLKLISDK